jgi:C1A family cysteine protease
MEYKLGFIPDPPSDKDYDFDRIRDKCTSLGFNDEYIIPEFTPISNQAGTNSCTCNAAMDALEILIGLEDARNVKQLSRLFTYWNARELDGSTQIDDGTYIRIVFECIMKFGVCSEDDWPFDPSKVLTKPRLMCYRNANDNQLSGFFRITSLDQDRANDIEAAIRFNHPVVLGIPVGSDFMNCHGRDIVHEAPSKSMGNHAIIVTGVRNSGNSSMNFYIRNSWGSGWGVNGHAWLSYDYIVNNARDLWVATRKPELLL